MKRLTVLLFALLVGLGAHAQLHILAELPGYDLSYSLESKQKRLFDGTHNLNLGHFGFRFADRVSVLIGGKVSFVQNNYGYHEQYFEGLQQQIPSLLVETPDYYIFGEWATHVQLRYGLKKSFMGEVELGLMYTWRWNSVDDLSAYEPQGVGHDPLTGYSTVESFKMYHISGFGERNGIASFSMRKYVNSNRIRFFVEPYLSAYILRIGTYSTVLSNEWQQPRVQIHDTRLIPEVGIKFGATWDREIHWFDFFKKLFEPIEE